MNEKETPVIVVKSDPKPGGINVMGFVPGSRVIPFSKDFVVIIPADKLIPEPKVRIH